MTTDSKGEPGVSGAHIFTLNGKPPPDGVTLAREIVAAGSSWSRS